jgi:hypothetical protein
MKLSTVFIRVPICTLAGAPANRLKFFVINLTSSRNMPGLFVN